LNFRESLNVLRWIKRIAIALVLVIVALVAAVWLFGPPVNVPLGGALASLFPDLFDPPGTDRETVERELEIREGYGLTLFAADVPDARMLRVTPAGDLLVASPSEGSVFLLSRDADGDGQSDGRKTLLDSLNGPNGLDFHDGYLYVGEESQVGRIAFAGDEVSGAYEVVVDDLPGGGGHWRKPLRFGPDGLMYVVVGSSCNVCEEEDQRRAAMLRFTPAGEYLGIYAAGLRNSAGFDWSPLDGELYATDNGRDLLGDDYPPCELNRIEEGHFYGWPYANGDGDADPDFGPGNEDRIAESTSPVFNFRAHNAPLGILFLRAEQHPEALRGQALVALHGSWNRSEKDGYKVVSLSWSEGGIVAEDFLTGFLTDDEVIGRPAELAEGTDGSVYISDDYANAVYLARPGGASTGVAATRREQSAQYLDERPAEAVRAEAMSTGGELYAASGCAACHNFDTSTADGQVPLNGLAGRYGVAELATYLMRPNPPMPPFTGTDEQRRLLSIYLLEASL
jgi:glucose/arabinose dehydrogenase